MPFGPLHAHRWTPPQGQAGKRKKKEKTGPRSVPHTLCHAANPVTFCIKNLKIQKNKKKGPQTCNGSTGGLATRSLSFFTLASAGPGRLVNPCRQSSSCRRAAGESIIVAALSRSRRRGRLDQSGGLFSMTRWPYSQVKSGSAAVPPPTSLLVASACCLFTFVYVRSCLSPIGERKAGQSGASCNRSPAFPGDRPTRAHRHPSPPHGTNNTSSGLATCPGMRSLLTCPLRPLDWNPR